MRLALAITEPAAQPIVRVAFLVTEPAAKPAAAPVAELGSAASRAAVQHEPLGVEQPQPGATTERAAHALSAGTADGAKQAAPESPGSTTSDGAEQQQLPPRPRTAADVKLRLDCRRVLYNFCHVVHSAVRAVSLCTFLSQG